MFGLWSCVFLSYTIGSHRLLGEMALLHGTAREATFRATGKGAVCWSLSREAFSLTLSDAIEVPLLLPLPLPLIFRV